MRRRQGWQPPRPPRPRCSPTATPSTSAPTRCPLAACVQRHDAGAARDRGHHRQADPDRHDRGGPVGHRRSGGRRVSCRHGAECAGVHHAADRPGHKTWYFQRVGYVGVINPSANPEYSTRLATPVYKIIRHASTARSASPPTARLRPAPPSGPSPATPARTTRPTSCGWSAAPAGRAGDPMVHCRGDGGKGSRPRGGCREFASATATACGSRRSVGRRNQHPCRRPEDSVFGFHCSGRRFLP